MTTVIIDYGGGNLHSAYKAFARMAREAGAGDVVVTSAPEDVHRASRVVLPGDGAFRACHTALGAISGMLEAIQHAVLTQGRPFLGICIGMQLMATRGLEFANTPGLDWISGTVEPLQPADPACKVPHMGWNTLQIDRPHPVLEGLALGVHAYFVHSFQFRLDAEEERIAYVDHGGPVTAIVGRDNLLGTQFHPEKSATTGLRIIANFLRWSP